MELNWTKMHEKGFSEGKKFPAPKFNAVKMAYGEISDDESFPMAKYTATKISQGKTGCPPPG